MVEPLDSGKILFRLNFQSDGADDMFVIDTPVGWEKLKITLKRGDKFSRFVQLDGELTFWNRPIEFGHELKRLIHHHKQFADEALVYLIVVIDGVQWMKAQLDFVNCKTDRESYFTTKLIFETYKSKIDGLKDVKVSLFDNESINGNALAPIQTEWVGLLPKKIREIATHTTGDEAFDVVESGVVADVGANNTTFPGGILDMGNPWGALIDDTVSAGSEYYVEPRHGYVNADGNAVPTTYTVGNLSSIENFWFPVQTDFKIDVSDLKFFVDVENIGNFDIVIQMAFITYNNAQRDNIVSASYVNLATVNNDKTPTISGSWAGIVPAYTRIIFEYRVNATGFSKRKTTDKITVQGGMFSAEIVGIYPTTTAKMIRLYDAGMRVIEAISEQPHTVSMNPISIGSLYFDSFVTSGSQVRGFQDSDFLMSFADFTKFLQNTLNADYQIDSETNDIFIGKHEDFYNDLEVGRIPFKPNIDSFLIELNKDLIKNEFLMSFDTFEKDEAETIDAFHTASEWYIPKRNNGKLESKINFIADGYSIEYARRQGIDTEKTTAKDKDEKIYIIDTVVKTINIPFLPPIQIRVNRQNDGFQTVNGIFSPETAYNLIYSIKRLIVDNYLLRLSEIGQVLGVNWIMRNKSFTANKDLETQTNLAGTSHELLIDSADETRFVQPKISPEIYTLTLNIRYKFADLLILFKKIVNLKGFVTLYTENTELKIYPYECDYDWNKEILTIKGERKYE